MDGQVLYEKWAEYQLQNYNCTCDSWDDLTDEDKTAWQHIAECAKAYWSNDNEAY